MFLRSSCASSKKVPDSILFSQAISVLALLPLDERGPPTNARSRHSWRCLRELAARVLPIRIEPKSMRHARCIVIPAPLASEARERDQAETQDTSKRWCGSF